ncbi:amino acid ABC transporter permease [Frigidibacter sp. MR17.14]|uniref:amino acid ABC transporter permease n=1 Tax=Frigidibacter sp. MR17.14 TaxID=3126509 RepID=UPI003012FE92
MWDVIVQTLPFLLEGFVNTIIISLAAIAGGSLIGLAFGVLRAVGPRSVSTLLAGYVHAIRATPILVQVYIVYYVLPATGASLFDLGSFSAAVIALTIYTSSYATEVVRGALQAVPKGQWEGAAAVGMSKRQMLAHVILPQAWKLMLPPLAGTYVLVIKGTSILSVIGVVELMREGHDAIHRHPADIMPILCLCAALYFAYCFPILRAIRHLERRLGGSRPRSVVIGAAW